jgi:hypothetical protein
MWHESKCYDFFLALAGARYPIDCQTVPCGVKKKIEKERKKEYLIKVSRSSSQTDEIKISWYLDFKRSYGMAGQRQKKKTGVHRYTHAYKYT